jgi:predicted RNase H-like HicB family nuclease
MDIEEYLAIPYILRMESDVGGDGGHIVRAEHPELAGCVAEGRSPREALERLEAVRCRLIETRYARGETVPVPRPPLPELLSPPRQSPRLHSIAGGRSANS